MGLRKGLFLVMEGGEGVGKTTNMAFIKNYLTQQSIAFSYSREPGGTLLAERIRGLLLERPSEASDENMSDMTEVLLTFAARAQHLQEKILPTLANGEWLVCDRFTDATYAYQGAGRQLDKSLIAQLEQMVQGDLRPDYTIILDAPVEVGHARASVRAELDRIESEAIDFHRRVRQGYLERAKAMPDKYAVIDASQNLTAVQQDIQVALDRLIKRYCHG